MPTTFIGDIQPTVAGGAAFNLQPPPGQAYKITEFSSDAVFVGDVPDLSVAILDGVLAACVVIIDPTTAVQKAARSKEILIDNGHYLQITNTAVGAANVGWCGVRVNANTIRTDVVTVPNAGDYDIRPPVGEVWRITEIGAETMGAANHPDMTFFATNGVLVVSATMDETYHLKQDKVLDWYVSNAMWVRVTDLSGADNDLAFCAELVDVQQVAGVFDVGGLGWVDLQPAAGQQAIMTEFSNEWWGFAPPAGGPIMAVSLFDGVNLSVVMTAGVVAASLSSDRTVALMIDNAHYLRMTQDPASPLPAEVGFLGYLSREFT